MAMEVLHYTHVYESPASKLKAIFGIIILIWLTFQSRKRHLLVKYLWLSNKKNVEMEINRIQSIFQSHENIKLTTIFQLSSLLRYRAYFKVNSMSKCRPLFNVEASMLYQIWLHDAVTNIQPYFNVDKTLCAGWVNQG